MSDIFDDPEGLSIKEERREKLKSTHPDKGGDENEFKKAFEEYEVKKEKVKDIIKEVEADIPKEIENKVEETDPVKRELNKLKVIEVTHNDPNNPYVEIKVPDSVKLGEKLVISISKKVPNIQIGFGDGLVWKRENKYDPDSKQKLFLKPTVLINKKRGDFNDDKIEIDVGLIKKVGRRDTQIWLSGDYLLEVRAFGRNWDEETSIRKTVKVVG